MKKNIVLLIIVALLSSCATKYYIYKIQLKKPSVSDELKYKDEKLSIEFTFLKSEVEFTLKNNSDKPLKIIWDDASFVYNGEAQKIIHKNVKFINKEKLQAPTVIPPKSFILDLIQPIDDIKFNEFTNFKYSYWSSQSIFPKIMYYKTENRKHLDRINKMLGTTVNIYIPIQQEGKTFDYYFEMEIIDILYKKSKNQTVSIFSK